MNQRRPDSARLRLRVSAAAQSILRSGHPWLFADSIQEQNREGRLGELAVIYDRNDRFLALGLFDPDSPIRVRILHSGKPQNINHDWWSARLHEGLDRRRDLFDSQTTGFRWLNGESDGWPGLVVDRYDHTLVLKLYTAAWLPRLDELLEILKNALKAERVVLRLSRNIQRVALNQFQKSEGSVLHGPSLNRRVVFLETGLRFEADVLRGQKTGFFLDQRENRRQVESFAKGPRVLNAFSFSGGFSLYAARGGARSVTDLDISAHALESARRNFALNHTAPTIAACKYGSIQADAFEWLDGNLNRKFDLIVLDPPSLAKGESERAGAIRAYQKLAALAIKHLDPDGILVACSCSAHVSTDEFVASIHSSARASRRKFQQLQTTGHAPDHPATIPEMHYLKAIYLRFTS